MYRSGWAWVELNYRPHAYQSHFQRSSASSDVALPRATTRYSPMLLGLLLADLGRFHSGSASKNFRPALNWRGKEVLTSYSVNGNRTLAEQCIHQDMLELLG
jgi:hypothetical protein